LLVSDNSYPGWRGNVDGRSQPILNADATICGVVVDKGKTYRHDDLLACHSDAGFLMLLAGAVVTAFAVRRSEQPGPDLLQAQN
jgi:hypothetical protein